jgi:flagellar hook assembly protein FlgD
VRTLVNGTQQSGHHVITWDGRNDEGSPVTSGIYFAELSGDDVHCICKIAFVR